jgi:broad specificity phosphatase PhoE
MNARTIDEARTITFLRHGQPDRTVGDHLSHPLTQTGWNQARAFANDVLSRLFDQEIAYATVITSGVTRAVQTAETICEGMSLKPRFHVVREMFDTGDDDEDNRRHEAARRDAYAKFGPQPLAKYHNECIAAMVDLGLASTEKLKPILSSTPGDVLIVGHGVYTNQIIMNLFFDEIGRNVRERLFNNSPLGECCGYHLHFEGNRLIEMEDILTDPNAPHPDEK